MKQATQNIQNVVTKDFIQTVKQIQTNATKYNFPNSVGDWNVAELQEKLLTVVDFLSKQKNLIIVDQYTQAKRNWIMNNLTQISNHIPQVSTWSNHLPSILTWTEAIYDFIYPDLIVSKDLGNYSQEMAELKQLKKEYISTTKDLLKLLENKDTANEFAKIIPDIQTKLQTSEASYQRIRELEQTIEQKRDNIIWFSEEIDDHKTTLQEVEKWYNDLSVRNQEETEMLINSNKELHIKVADLLSSTIGWKSSEKLKERASKINYNKWIWWIFSTTLIAVIFWCAVFWTFKPFILWIESIEWMSSLQLIILRFSIFIPFLLLDIFFYSQFSFEKKLKEEYEFRAIISWTLETYIQLLKDNWDRQEHKDFIIATANRIFTSPIWQTDEIKLSDIKDISKQAIQATIDKIWWK